MPAEVITTNCPGCRKPLRVPKDWVGRTMRCKHCRATIQARPKTSAAPTMDVLAADTNDIESWAEDAAPFTEFSPEGFPIEPMLRREPYRPRRSNAKWIIGGLIAFMLTTIAGVLIANRGRLAAGNGSDQKKKVVVADRNDGKPPPVKVPDKIGPFPRRMLAVSINNYLYCNPVLFGSATRSVAVLLERLGDKWRIPRDQLFLLTDAATNRGATPPIKPILMATIESFLQTSRPADRIVLLFSGHATVIDSLPYLVPFDGELTNKESLVPLAWLMDKLKSCPAQQKLLIFDVARNDPGRGIERPTPGAMDPAIEAMLKSPPEGVRVWSSCSARQSSLEYRFQSFEDNEVEGGLFLNQMYNVLFRSGIPQQKPEEPLPIESLTGPVIEATQKFAKNVEKAEQTPFVAGTGPTSGPEYDPAEPAATRIKIPKPAEFAPGGLADPALVKAIFAEIKMPPIKATNMDDAKTEELDTIFPFSKEALKDYETDGVTAEQLLQEPDKYPLRVGVLKAVEILERHGKGDVMVGKTLKHMGLLREEFAGPTSDAVKQSIAKEQQEGPAAMFLELEDLVTMLEKLAPQRDKETSKRWKAHYDYVTAMTKARFAYVNEYNFMLGKIRKDDLPPLDPKLHKGWRLAAAEKMSSPRDVKDKADDARKLFNKLIKENPGTPWEILAKRERLTAVGLTWQPVAVKQ